MIAHDAIVTRGVKPRASVVICLDLHRRLFSPEDEKESDSGRIYLVSVAVSDFEVGSMAAKPRNSWC